MEYISVDKIVRPSTAKIIFFTSKPESARINNSVMMVVKPSVTEYIKRENAVSVGVVRNCLDKRMKQARPMPVAVANKAKLNEK